MIRPQVRGLNVPRAVIAQILTTAAAHLSPLVDWADLDGPFLTARDPFGNVDVNYRGTVTFTSSNPQAVLPSAYPFTAADNGVHTFAITLKTAG